MKGEEIFVLIYKIPFDKIKKSARPVAQKVPRHPAIPGGGSMIRISVKKAARPARGLTAALFLFSILFLVSHPALAISVSAGEPAPDFQAQTMAGETVTLSEMKGKVVFVAFWSSWCSRCKEEMDYLKDLKERYPEVVFLAINAESEEPDEETLGRMQKAVQDWEVPFTVLIDRGLKIWDLYKVNALPTSFIVGSDGIIAFAEPNFYFASPENIDNAMDQLMNPDLKISQASKAKAE